MEAPIEAQTVVAADPAQVVEEPPPQAVVRTGGKTRRTLTEAQLQALDKGRSAHRDRLRAWKDEQQARKDEEQALFMEFLASRMPKEASASIPIPIPKQAPYRPPAPSFKFV